MFMRIIGIDEHDDKDESAADMMSLLNTIFTEFDRLASQYQLEKIKTIGTCYMIVGKLIGVNISLHFLTGGLPVPRATHAEDIAEMALRCRRLISSFKTNRSLDVQIGIHTGPCVAGIIGTKKISFDLWVI